LDIDMPFDI